MDTNRSWKRTDYALPPKRSLRASDKLGERHQTSDAASKQIQVIQVTESPELPESAAASTQPPTPLEQVLEPPKAQARKPIQTVHEEPTSRADDGVIDLSEPTRGGWLDAIVPEPDDDELRLNVAPVEITEMAVDQQQPGSLADIAPEAGAEAATAALQPPQTNISIQISVPHLRWPKWHLPALPYKRIAIWTAIVVGTIIVAVVGLVVVKHFFFHPKPMQALTGAQALAAGLSRPTFVPVAPKDKPQLAQGNSRGTAFDGRRDSYSYTDSMGGVPFTVSEQPMPATFSSASQGLAAVAKSVGASTVIPTKGLSAYETNNSKTSTQTIVFSVNNLLVFIQSYFPHNNGAWAQYINSLSS